MATEQEVSIISYVDYARSVLAGLVDFPDHIRIEQQNDERGVLLNINVHPLDMGKAIGKQGATIEAVKKLVGACGMRSRALVSVKLLEPDGSERPTRK